MIQRPACFNIQHEETGRLQEWDTIHPIPPGWIKVSETYTMTTIQYLQNDGTIQTTQELQEIINKIELSGWKRGMLEAMSAVESAGGGNKEYHMEAIKEVLNAKKEK